MQDALIAVRNRARFLATTPTDNNFNNKCLYSARDTHTFNLRYKSNDLSFLFHSICHCMGFSYLLNLSFQVSVCVCVFCLYCPNWLLTFFVFWMLLYSPYRDPHWTIWKQRISCIPCFLLGLSQLIRTKPVKQYWIAQRCVHLLFICIAILLISFLFLSNFTLNSLDFLLLLFVCIKFLARS